MTPSSVQGQVRDEIRAMTTYALGGGLDVPASTLAVAARLDQETALGEGEWKAAVRAHRTLQQLVAPALPRTILLFENERRNRARFAWLPSLGPIRLVRQLTGLSVVLMIVFVGLALSPDIGCDQDNVVQGGVDATCQMADLFANDGLQLLVNLLFLLAAAGLGATFAGLWRAMKYIGQGTFDPTYEATYWVRIVLGLVSGLLLAELLPEIMSEGQPFQSPLGRPVLALVGGFSAGVLFRILQRLTSAVESVFTGDAAAAVELEVQKANASVAQQLGETRLQLAAKLLDLHRQLQDGAGSADAVVAVGKLLDELLPVEEETPPTWRGTPSPMDTASG